ncbi:MAG: glycosyltransferase family 4 protein [Pseudomonadota bacterium]
MNKKKRIAFLGPISPFRGGVARHTTLVAQALKTRTDLECRVLSFRRLYPEFLYPGESATDEHLKTDPSLEAEFIVDAVNPLNWRSVAKDIKRWGPDIIMVPAWTFFVSPCLTTILKLARTETTEVVILVHNDADHEASGWKNFFSNLQLRQADRFVAHSRALAGSLEAVHPKASTRVHPMPIFDDYPIATDPPDKRAGLELLFFGFVRHYKGVDTALEALAKTKRQDIKLTIAGEFWDDRAPYDALIETLGIGERVDIIDRYVSDGEAAGFFARADAVVLPYRSVTGSAVVALAYHYLKPVIATNLTGLLDVVSAGTTGWTMDPEDSDALANLLDTQITRVACADMAVGIEAFRAVMSWENLVKIVLDENAQLAPAEAKL